MEILLIPWYELAILMALAGWLLVSRARRPEAAARLGMGLTGLIFGCTFLSWLGFHLGVTPEMLAPFSLQQRYLGRMIFAVDGLSAPLVPAIALSHFLTAVTTARTRWRYFSFSWSLASEGVRLAMFGCAASWLLVGLFVLCAVPPYFELVNRSRPTRVYIAHMIPFAVLLVLGWAAVQMGGAMVGFGSVLLMLAILIRCGTVPAHCWVTDWFEHASFGNGLLFATPLAGVLATVRLVLPVAPDWVLKGIALASLVTAVYSAAMASVQRDTRRFYANLFLSHASLVLVGLELHTSVSLTASLCLWFSVILSLTGFGLTLRALEARVGRPSLAEYSGLYGHSPTLAVCFLLTGLACVGFPGTLGFISTELLVDSAVEANPTVGIAVVTAAALNGIAVLRAYFRLFTGTRHVSTVSLGIGHRERAAVLTLSALILGGGFYPQPGVQTRQKAAEVILHDRVERYPAESEEIQHPHDVIRELEEPAPDA